MCVNSASDDTGVHVEAKTEQSSRLRQDAGLQGRDKEVEMTESPQIKSSQTC